MFLKKNAINTNAGCLLLLITNNAGCSKRASKHTKFPQKQDYLDEGNS